MIILKISLVDSTLSHWVGEYTSLTPGETSKTESMPIYLVLVAAATNIRSRYHIPATLLSWYLVTILWSGPRRLVMRTLATRDFLRYMCYYISLVALLCSPILLQLFISSQRLVAPHDIYAIGLGIIALIPCPYLNSYGPNTRIAVAHWIVTIVVTVIEELVTALSEHYGVLLIERDEPQFTLEESNDFWGFGDLANFLW